MLLTIYLLSIVGAYLESRRDFKKGKAEPSVLYLLLIFCPVINSFGAIFYVFSLLEELFIKLSSPKVLRKFFFLDK